MQKLTPSRTFIQGMILLGIVVIAGLIRGIAYGDLRLSIGNGETKSYIASSLSPLLSWKAFAGQRLFTTNLIYKLADDPRECKLLAVSDPTGDSHVRPVLQPCFDRIALLQNVLSILAWCFLAWTTARWMTTFPAKVGVALAVLLFGFTPQIAEWDTLLSPESLSVTGYVFLLALLEEIVLGIRSGSDRLGSRRSKLMIGAWLLVFALWVFIRDVHLYAIPVTLLMLAGLLLFNEFRHQTIIWAAAGILVLILMVGYTSAQSSLRATHYPLAHAFEDYVLPFPNRVAFFSRFGMPEPTEPSYQSWLDRNATATYAAFLITHPGFIWTSVFANLYYFRAEYVQQYFEPRPGNSRALLLQLGESFHPETMAVYVIDVLCLLGLWLAARQGFAPMLGGWAWIGTWFFLACAAMLFVGFFGDAEAARRHIYPSIEAFRLLMWLLIFVYFDRALVKLPVSEPSRTGVGVDA
jgi:hypothetical protein